MGRKKKTYSDEFKRKCILELLDGKPFSEVAASNNLAPSTLSDWKKAFVEGSFSKKAKQAEKETEEYMTKYLKAMEVIGKKKMEIELLRKTKNLCKS